MKKYINQIRYITVSASFGVKMALYIYLGYLGGSWLDKKVGTESVFMLAGILLGIFLGFYNLYYDLMRLLKMTEQQKKDGDKGPDYHDKSKQ